MEGYTKIGRIRPNYTGTWNAETAYTVLEMVKNEAGTASYIAKQDVPAGTPLTDEAYWAMVLDAGDVIAAAERATADANNAAQEYAELDGRVDQLSEDIDEIVVKKAPQDYAPDSVDDFVKTGASTNCELSYTDNTLTIDANAAVNHTIGMYIGNRVTVGKSYKISFDYTRLGTNGGVALTDGAGGPTIQMLTDAVSPGRYEGYFTATASMWLTIWMRYDVSTATISNISIIDSDAKTERAIKTELVRGLSAENMDASFLERIGYQQGPCDYDGCEISVFDKILCIGDSLTAGVFNHYADGEAKFVTIGKYSYPTYLQKLTGVPCENMGNGGYTSAGWYDLHAADDLSGFDCAIIQMGVNDAIQYNAWTDTSATAFANIINKLQTENPGVKIFVATIIPATSYTGERYDLISQGIREFVATLNDDNVILLDMAVYGHTADSTAYNRGHLSAYGYWRLASDYKSYIGWYMHNNKDVFGEIQFAGTDYQYN